MDIERLQQLLSQGRTKLRFSDHAFVEARKDGLDTRDLRLACESGEMIEDYGVRALLLQFTEERLPYHVVVEYVTGAAQTTVVTAYIPEADQWQRDWKTRRRKRRK